MFERDVACPGCGYNLRGLPRDRPCPECGAKLASPTPVPGEPSQTERIEAEIAEHIQRQEADAARLRRLDQLLEAWERRGERFDRLMDRLEQKLGPEAE